MQGGISADSPFRIPANYGRKGTKLIRQNHLQQVNLLRDMKLTKYTQ